MGTGKVERSRSAAGELRALGETSSTPEAGVRCVPGRAQPCACVLSSAGKHPETSCGTGRGLR